MWHISLVVILLGTAKFGLVRTTCLASVPTIHYVTSCPSNEKSWKEAELKKNCESLANIQQCVKEPSNFTYHCLVNRYLNATLEVCAPIRFVSGYCADFDTIQNKVTENHNIDCTKLEPACPKRYVSTDVYKYPSCYKLKENNQSFEKTTHSSQISRKETNNNYDDRTLSVDHSILQESSTSIFVYKKMDTRSTNNAVIAMGAVLPLFVAISIYFAVKKIRKMFKTHKMSKNPLHDAKVHRYDEEENLELCPKGNAVSEKLDGEEDDAAYNKEGKTEQYYRLVPKDRSNLREDGGDPTEMLASLNKDMTDRFFDNARSADSFYEETKVYKIVENLFNTKKVVILTGPPGFGKTQTAIHLIMPYKKMKWEIRKVESYFELNYIDCTKNTIIFIDNIFCGKLNEYAEWMNPLERLDRIIRGMCNNCSKSENNGGAIRVVITAKSDIIDEACDLMKKRGIFREDYIINLSEEQYELENEEKKRILRKQIEYANQEKKIKSPDLTDSFWEKVTKARAPIGFPLCAHLFAFEETYHRKREDFFLWPTQAVLKKIEDVIENDKTNRKKTLLLFLLLLKIHNRNKDQESKYKPELESEKKCADFLKKKCGLRDYFQPLNFKDLQSIASEMSFVRETDEKSYQFTHQSVFDAVECYFFRTFPFKCIALLPLEVIERQTNDKEDLTWLRDDHFKYLVQRFITEVKNGRISRICECDILKRTEFIHFFLEAVASLGDKDLVNFFATKSQTFPKLPILFWLGRSENTHLLEKLLSVIEKRENKDINSEDHIYYSLYGECTKRDPTSIGRLTDSEPNDTCIKDRVLSFKDNTDNTILHIVVKSAREDDFASCTVKKLINDREDIINACNRYRMTPLMLAVTLPFSRQRVIEVLVNNNCAVDSKDRNENSVFHCCVDADTDDFTCASIINIVLGTKERVDLSMCNTHGLTALNLACENTKYSRILSICKLLYHGYNAEQNDNKYREIALVDKLDNEGKNPIFNAISCLTGEDELVEIERLLRVCILLLYGADPYLKSDDADRSAFDLCKEKCYGDLAAIMKSIPNSNKNDINELTESRMLEALNKGIKRLSKNHTTGDQLNITIKFPPKIPDEMTKCLASAIQYMAKKPLIRSSKNENETLNN
ncbi:uncharacterized protein LOC134247157 [Saccostrea cucullata]|uniref:uncharacterized protein LOC134247157 n=1 Tax=Saccostrea cuccullata TaxID=36930 RepID=UPI002ED36792